MTAYHTEDYIDDDGSRFRVEYEYDHDADYPWENAASYYQGIVSDWTTRDKRPGELLLCESRGFKRYYDFQGSLKRAKDEDWDSVSLLPKKERGIELVCLVREDYERIRDWCNDKWHYMGIVAFPLTADGDELRSQEQSTWGIESDTDPAFIQEQTAWLLSDVGANAQLHEVES